MFFIVLLILSQLFTHYIIYAHKKCIYRCKDINKNVNNKFQQQLFYIFFDVRGCD